MKAQGAGKAQIRARNALAPVARKLWSIEVSGIDRLPTSGPAILCPNHVSFLDSAFLMLVVSRNISFVGKAEYMDSWKTKFLFPMMGMIPIDRSGGEKSQAALDAAEYVLSRGELFGLFPEGTRSRDGSLYKGRTGIARMAIESGAAIVPVAMFNTAEIQPTGQVVPKVQRVEMIFGEPLYYKGDTSDLKVLREITDEIMQKIQELSGQEYVDMYASEAKIILMKQRREEAKKEKREKE